MKPETMDLRVPLCAVACTLLLALPAAGFEHELKVHADETIWETLQKERDASEKEDAASWKKRSIEELEKNGNVYSSIVKAVRELPKDRQDALKAKLDHIPKLNHAGKLLLLNAMGDAAAGEEVVRLLKTAEDDAVLIDLLRGLWHEEWQRLPVPSGKLPELLLDVSQRSGKRVQSFLYRELEQIPAEQWQERMMKLAGDPQYKARPEALGLLAKKGQDARLIPLLGDAFRTAQPEDNIYALAGLLEKLAANPELKSAAVDELVKCIEGKGALEASPAVADLIRIDLERGLPFAEKLAEAIANAETLPKQFTTWPSLNLWAKRKKMDALPVLMRCLRHEKSLHEILPVFAAAASGTGDPEVVELLWSSIERKSHVWQSLYGLLEVGGKVARAKVAGYLEKNGSVAYLGFRWRLLGITLESVCKRAVEMGMLSRLPNQAEYEAVRRESSMSDPRSQFFSLLYRMGYVAEFDGETDTFPNRHDELIAKDFVQASAGKFKVEEAVEVYVRDGNYYKVAFKSGGKWFQFKAIGLGDWYDTETVELAVNRALEESGIAERFNFVPEGGQCCTYLFAKPEVFKAFCREFMIPTGGSADEARRLGQEFEEKVRRQLEQK